MLQTHRLRPRLLLRTRGGTAGTDGCDRLAIGVSLSGVLLGAILGSVSDPERMAGWGAVLRPLTGPVPPPAVVLAVCALLFAATSYLGPALAALCQLTVSWRLGCSAASLCALGGAEHFRSALLWFGVPALIVFPCLAALTAECCRRSLRLLRLRAELPAREPLRPLWAALLPGAIAALVSAVYPAYLLPLLT